MNHWYRVLMKLLQEMMDWMNFVIDSRALFEMIELENPNLCHCQQKFALLNDATTNSSLLAKSMKMVKLANFYYEEF